MAIEAHSFQNSPTLVGHPNCPADVIVSTLAFLPIETLGACQLVCKRWLTLCQTRDPLRVGLGYFWATKRIKKIRDSKLEILALLTLAKGLSTTHFLQARDLLIEIGKRLTSMPEIADANRILAQFDFDLRKWMGTEGLAPYEAFLKLKDRSEVNRSICLKLAEIDLQRAHEFAVAQQGMPVDELRAEIITLQSLKEPDSAIQQALSSPLRSSLLEEIIKHLSKMDLVKAKETAGLITNIYARYRALKAIVAQEALTDPLQAITTSRMADESLQDELLLEIFRIQLQKHDPSAKETKQLIRNGEIKEEAYILMLINNREFNLAKSRTNARKDVLKRAQLLLEIVKAEIPLNWQGAKVTAAMISPENHVELAEALIDIASQRPTPTAPNYSPSPQRNQITHLAQLAIHYLGQFLP